MDENEYKTIVNTIKLIHISAGDVM